MEAKWLRPSELAWAKAKKVLLPTTARGARSDWGLRVMSVDEVWSSATERLERGATRLSACCAASA